MQCEWGGCDKREVAGDCNLLLVLKVTRGCGDYAVTLAAEGREGWGRVDEAYSVGVGGGGVGRTEEMRLGKHCENVTATLTAGQFSKKQRCRPHPPLSHGGRGGGTRLHSQRDVFIK